MSGMTGIALAERSTNAISAQKLKGNGGAASVCESGTLSRKTTAATHVIKTGPGTLIGFHCAVATGTLTLWDNTSTATTQISGAITLVAGFTRYPVDFDVGLTAVLSGAADVTFIYK